MDEEYVLEHAGEELDAAVDVVNQAVEGHISLDARFESLESHIPVISATEISNDSLAEMYSGTIAGLIATEITGESAEVYGVVRAYSCASEVPVVIQICECETGQRLTRCYKSSAWSSWA